MTAAEFSSEVVPWTAAATGLIGLATGVIIAGIQAAKRISSELASLQTQITDNKTRLNTHSDRIHELTKAPKSITVVATPTPPAPVTVEQNNDAPVGG